MGNEIEGKKEFRVVVTRDGKIVGIVTSKDLMPITAFAEGDRLQTNPDYDDNNKQEETED